jgi:thymidylate synthase
MKTNSLNNTIQNLLNEDVWAEVAPRGFKTIETINQQLYLHPRRVVFNTETRPFNWKYFIGEFKWFLSKNGHISGISPSYSKFWLKLQNERGEVNSNYGKILLSNRGTKSQLYWVYQSLIKDKFTRQAIAFISGDRYQFEGNLDFPCTIYLNFFIRENELNMVVRMRSNDIGFGLTYDAPWFSLLQQNLLLLLLPTYPELQLGTYIHSADNLHYYERHYEDMILLKNRMDQENKEYEITLLKPFFLFEDGMTILSTEAQNFMDSVDSEMNENAHFKAFNKICEVHYV